MKVLVEKKTKWGKYYSVYFWSLLFFCMSLIFFFDLEGACNALKVSGNIFIG